LRDSALPLFMTDWGVRQEAKADRTRTKGALILAKQHVILTPGTVASVAERGLLPANTSAGYGHTGLVYVLMEIDGLRVNKEPSGIEPKQLKPSVLTPFAPDLTAHSAWATFSARGLRWAQ
jgi:hypothetical protein